MRSISVETWFESLWRKSLGLAFLPQWTDECRVCACGMWQTNLILNRRQRAQLPCREFERGKASRSTRTESRPQFSYSPAIERFVPNHVVEDPLGFPLNPLFGDPAGGHQHDRQEAPANGGHDNLSNRWPRQSNFCTAGRADVIHTRSVSLPWSR
jgi:hypothetical protein